MAVTANFAIAGGPPCGSVRYAAVLNDLYGLRPTEGVSSARPGVIPCDRAGRDGPMAAGWWSGDRAGRHGRADPADPITVPVDASYVDAVDPNGLADRRIGLLPYTLNREYDALMSAAIADMQANGTDVVDVELPPTSGVGQAFDEFDTAINDYLAAHPNAPAHSMSDLATFYRASNPELDYAAIGSYTQPVSLDNDTYRDSLQQRGIFRDNVAALMDELDLNASLTKMVIAAEVIGLPRAVGLNLGPPSSRLSVHRVPSDCRRFRHQWGAPLRTCSPWRAGPPHPRSFPRTPQR